MNQLTQTLQSHLKAADDEGRMIGDGEAKLIEVLASMPSETAAVDSQAREAIGALRNEIEATRSAQPVPFRVNAELLPDAAGMQSLLDAIKARQPISVQAASYDVQRPVEVSARQVARLVDRLGQSGAQVGPVARKLEVPRIASGDAAVWTVGDKAEIVTELALIEADVIAAWTEIAAMNLLDITSLELQLSTLLGRRVVAQENVAVAESLLAQATVGTAGADAVEAVVNAILAVSASGAGASFLMLSTDIASGVMASAQAGYAGLDTYWRGSMYGLPFAVVPGLTANTAIAADASALVIGRTPVLQLSDPYSGSKRNSVILRTETSVAVAVLDPTAVGTAGITVAP